jgi:hypothetical protein
MRQSGFRAWKVFGGLAAALLSVGCGRLPDTGGPQPDSPPEDFFGGRVDRLSPDVYARAHVSTDRGYNGTIQQLGSSIDPRTPQRLGQQGNSLQVDVTGRPAPRAPELGIGGSGYVGEPDRSSNQGWRARRGYEVGPATEHGAIDSPDR